MKNYYNSVCPMNRLHPSWANYPEPEHLKTEQVLLVSFTIAFLLSSFLLPQTCVPGLLVLCIPLAVLLIIGLYSATDKLCGLIAALLAAIQGVAFATFALSGNKQAFLTAMAIAGMIFSKAIIGYKQFEPKDMPISFVMILTVLFLGLSLSAHTLFFSEGSNCLWVVILGMLVLAAPFFEIANHEGRRSELEENRTKWLIASAHLVSPVWGPVLPFAWAWQLLTGRKKASV